MPTIDPPLALLAELTHRCPLACPYCSNPVNLERAAGELGELGWRRVLTEAAAVGVLQVHFSGGEPMARRDLVTLIGAANGLGLYSNLITSGTLGGAREIDAFAAAELKHVQLSFQDFAEGSGDRIAGLAGAHARKTRFAGAPPACRSRSTWWGVLTIDYVVPDYHGVRPKSCMSGWGRQFLNVTPSGIAVPCHAAELLPGIAFPR